MTDNSFIIKPYHWWLTFGLAILFHAILLMNYKQEETHSQNHNEDSGNEIVIGLIKLKSTPIIEKPASTISATVAPSKPKPVVEIAKISKPKLVVQPKPIIAPPKIAPVNSAKKQSNTIKQAVKSTALKNEKVLYYIKLAKWLERHKKYPTLSRKRNQQGNVTIQFVIDREGCLLRHQLVKPSEHRSLNTAAIKMLERASPMPAPPEALIGDKTELEYSIPVNFSLINKN